MSLWIDQQYIGTISIRLDKFSRKGDYLYNFRCPICGDSQTNRNKELEEIFANLRSEKEELIKNYKELAQTQNEFGKELTQKYGVGSYDIDTNTFTSAQ